MKRFRKRHNIVFKFTAVLIAGLLSLLPAPSYAMKVSVNAIADLRGWAEGFNPKTVSMPVTGGPVLADLDCDYDNLIEVIASGYDAGSNKSIVCVWTQYGAIMPGWPKELEGVKAEYNPAVGDLDGDGDLEIVVSGVKSPQNSGGWIYAWHHDGNVFNGYPKELNNIPGASVCGDVSSAGIEESFVFESDIGTAVCDVDLDGRKEIIKAGISEVRIENGDGTLVSGWPKVLDNAVSVGVPVAGDVNGDGIQEIFLAVKKANGNFIYGWNKDGAEIAGCPINIGDDVENTNGEFLSLGDINGDRISEILSGSSNGWVIGWKLDGTGAGIFRTRISSEENVKVYEPIVGDFDALGGQEIIITSSNGNLYLLDRNGNLLEGYPKNLSQSGLSPSVVVFDQDRDGKAELMVGTLDKKMYLLDLSGNYNPNNIQWGMHGFNSRNSGNYLRDWDIAGWTIIDNNPAGAVIESVYDWNRGSRVIELKGAGINNAYAFKKSDGKPFNSKNTALQWAMRYSLPFYIYVSIDTIKGKRYLCYSPTEGNQDMDGSIIYHGLGGSAKNGMWHTFNRNLVQDLKDAEQDNDVVDVNAVYVQGSGLIDDIILIPGLPCVDIVNLALNAQVAVSSGEASKGSINDGDGDTKWVSDSEANSWVKYTWENPEKVNKITLDAVEGATSGIIIVTDVNGNTYSPISFNIPQDGSSVVVAFDSRIDNVKSIMVYFNNNGQSVSAGEIGVYYDPNLEEEQPPPQEEYPAGNYIRMQDGYFFSPVTNNYWIPHGIAYQTWNAATGQWQTPAELKSDLDGMVEAGVNAIRVDFVWKYIEVSNGEYSWNNYDMLLQEAKERGIKVFPIIGYQWPPDWFDSEWYTMHPQNEQHPGGPWKSDILSYEHPDVLIQFSDFLQAVANRYSVGGARPDLADTIAGWILGNEYGYLGLWSVEYDGYDPECQKAFRHWLEKRYGNIDALRARWINDNVNPPNYLPHYPYTSFDDVDMPIPFGYQGETRGKYLARDKASWYDLTQWREESIAKFIALAAKAVWDAEEQLHAHHLISYASVGMQWGEEDWRYHTEDIGKIAKECKEMGAPLDFWSINNYPWGLENSELMTGQWGIEKARHDTKLPVMITETGFTTTETMYPGISEEKQARLVRNSIWESLESGAIGVCVFHWNDRDMQGLTEREKGFGIVRKGVLNKEPKPAYFAVKDAFKKMDELNIAKYLVKSNDPVPNIAFLWDDATDTIVNRYKAEVAGLFGTLERLGYEPTFINDEELINRDYKDYNAIILPRNQKMFKGTFNMLGDIKTDGVNIHADAGLPGIMDEYGEERSRLDWLLVMKDLFGIDASNSRIDPDLEDSIYIDGYETSSFGINYMPKRVVYSDIGFDKTLKMWKYRDAITVDGGIVKANFDSADGNPALVFNSNAAISLFGLGDNSTQNWTWADRYDWMKSIYADPNGFNMPLLINVSNKYVLVDYRTCQNGSILLSFKNYKSDVQDVNVETAMITGKTVKDLLTNTIIEDPCDGNIQRTLEPDGHDLVLAYNIVPAPGGGPGNPPGGSDNPPGNDKPPGSGGNPPGSGDNPPDTGHPPDNNNSSSNKNKPPANTDNKNNGGEGGAGVNTDDGEDNNDSHNVMTGPASVVILVDDENKYREDNIGNSGKTVQTSKSSAAKDESKQSNIRSYFGSDNRGKESKESVPAISVMPESNYPINEQRITEEVPPLEQFRQAMGREMYNDTGITRVKPEIISPAKLQEVVRQSKLQPAVAQPKNLSAPINFASILNIWISKIKNWWQDLVKIMKLAGRNISRRYA